jgi:hypothetical protein
VLSDSRWPGRLCGGWRDERGKIRTLWARSLDASAGDTRYLYLRGAPRGAGIPYAFQYALKVLEIASKYRKGESWEYIQPAEFKM